MVVAQQTRETGFMQILKDKTTGSALYQSTKIDGTVVYSAHICSDGVWFTREFTDSDAAVDFYYDALAAGAEFSRPQGYGF
jgi:hypothetical protein